MINKTAYIIHLIPIDGIGGVETAARSILSNRTNDTYCFKIMLIAGKSLSPYKSKVIESPFRSPNNPLAHLQSLYKIINEKPNILVCSLWRSIPIGLCIKLLQPKIHIVYFLHLSSTMHIFDHLFSRLMLSFCDAVWADSEATLISRLKGKKINSITKRVISFVISKPVSTEKTPNILSPRFIFWGRLNKQKGIDRSIHLINLLINQGVVCNFEIWGPDGGELNNLMTQVKTLKLEQYIHFMGSFKHNQLTTIANKNSFYLQLSHIEGMAMSVVESMQYGLVPIVTPVGEIKSYCKNDLNSIVVNVNNFNETADKIKGLLADAKKYNTMQFFAQKTWSDAPLYKDDFLLASKDILKNG